MSGAAQTVKGHRRTTTEGMTSECHEGTCGHASTDECVVMVDVCGPCLDALGPDYDGPLPKWPCGELR